jgi:hypothetical protein
MSWETVNVRVLWVVAIFGVSLAGCAPETVQLWDKQYQLRSATESTAVDLTGVPVLGSSDERERRAIGNCLGRIPVTNLYVKAITVVWSERPIAARVSLDRGTQTRCILFLARDHSGSYRIEGSTTLLIDSLRAD